jgi:hypothetical protein
MDHLVLAEGRDRGVSGFFRVAGTEARLRVVHRRHAALPFTGQLREVRTQLGGGDVAPLLSSVQPRLFL